MNRRFLTAVLAALLLAAGCRPADGGSGPSPTESPPGPSPTESAPAPSQAESSAPATDDGGIDYGY